MLSLISFLIKLGSMLYVDFRKSRCRPVEFRGQGPFQKDERGLARSVGGGG